MIQLNILGNKLISFIIIFCICLPIFIKAQLIVDNSKYTPEQLVQNVLLGKGISVSNINYNGAAVAIGFFDGSNTNIGIDSGIVICSGDINNAVGPNLYKNKGFSNGSGSDTDLVVISGYSEIFDAAVMEFDFIPSTDTLRFKYVFGSEEYMEFVDMNKNDAFGFFISGPGITGPYSNNSQNLALIPGTTTPVTINNVNKIRNSAYWFDNEIPPGSTIEYDGFTTVLEAILPVQCFQTYHIKIAIGDGGDAVYDSGVFLEAGSFSSGSDLELTSSAIANDTICPTDNVEISCSANILNIPYTWDFDGGTVVSGSGLGPYLVNWTSYGLKRVKLSAEDDCADYSEEIEINITDCAVKAPNVFTPNGDGINEFFKFKNVEKYPGSILEVYNRWGQKVFENSNYANNWLADNVSDGTYYYVMKVSNGQLLTGFVTVIR